MGFRGLRHRLTKQAARRGSTSGAGRRQEWGHEAPPRYRDLLVPPPGAGTLELAGAVPMDLEALRLGAAPQGSGRHTNAVPAGSRAAPRIRVSIRGPERWGWAGTTSRLPIPRRNPFVSSSPFVTARWGRVMRAAAAGIRGIRGISFAVGFLPRLRRDRRPDCGLLGCGTLRGPPPTTLRVVPLPTRGRETRLRAPSVAVLSVVMAGLDPATQRSAQRASPASGLN
jgi:hypothetical protein